MDFYSLEAQDGVRLSWNNIPSTKLAATRSVLPIGVHYNPYRDLDNLVTLEYAP
jgi:protein transport protein SEC23